MKSGWFFYCSACENRHWIMALDAMIQIPGIQQDYIGFCNLTLTFVLPPLHGSKHQVRPIKPCPQLGQRAYDMTPSQLLLEDMEIWRSFYTEPEHQIYKTYNPLHLRIVFERYKQRMFSKPDGLWKCYGF